MGLKLAPLTDQLRKRMGVAKGVKGVVITAVSDNSPLTEFGIQPGDVIESINQQPVSSPQDVAKQLQQAQKGSDKNLLLLLNRHGVNQYVALSFGNDTGNGDNG
jgi:serine protease Do